MKKLLASLSVLSVLFFFTPLHVEAAGIAFDSVLNESSHSAIGSGSGSVTDTFTNTAGTFMVVVANMRANSDSDGLSSPTYNGTALTAIAPRIKLATGEWMYGWYLANPPTGSHTLSISYSFSGSGNQIKVNAASWSGASLTGQPDNSTSGTGGGTSLTASLTTIADNAWTVLLFSTEQGGTAASTGSTQRGTNDGSFAYIFDSNGPVHPAGSKSMSVTYTSYTPTAYMMLSIAPAASAAASFVPWQFWPF